MLAKEPYKVRGVHDRRFGIRKIQHKKEMCTELELAVISENK